MGAYDRGAEVPIIVRGDGCYVWDEHGNRYLDGLSALFCANIGHGRADIAQAGADQAKELGFFTNWSYAHPRAIELAAKIAVARPGRPQPRLLHERRQRGRRVRAQARPPVPQAHRQPDQDEGHRARDRLPRHDARRAHRDRHHRPARAVRAVHARRLPRAEHEHLPARPRATASRTSPRRSRTGSSSRARSTVAAVILEPVQNAGGCFTPPEGYFAARARDLRPLRRPAHLRRGHLLVGPARRVVRRPALRLPARHHHDRQGHHLGLRADGRDDRLRPGHRAVPATATTSFIHGFTFGGHPVAAAVALANIAVFEDEGILENVRAQRGRAARDARVAARHPDRRRRARRRLLPRDRAGQGPGDQGVLRRTRSPRRCCAASSRGELFRARPDLPRRRPRRPGRSSSRRR